MFKIGDFSKLCRVPVSALRYYADIGLLEPAHIDQTRGFRFYTVDQLPRLNRILALKDLGLSLEQIKQILQDDLTSGEIRGMLRLKEHEIQQELAEAEARLNRVKVRLAQIEREDNLPAAEVVVKEVPQQRILAMRDVIPVPNLIEDLFYEIYMIFMKNPVKLAGQPMTIFHDAEFKEADMDVELAFPVMPEVETQIALANNRILKIRTLERLETAASIIHTGSYDRFPETYEIIGRWIDANGYRIAGVAREIYLRPPSEDEPAITEIQFPIVKD